jgi:hypothetical protein
MPISSRLFLAAGLLVGLLASLFCLMPQALSPLGLDFGDLPAQYRRMDELRQRGEELDRNREALLRRIEAKEAVVAELVAGRLTLLQAAARFRALKGDPPGVAELFPPEWGRSEGERLCREVMVWVNGWLAERAPERAAAVAARLEAELRQHRDPSGTVRLPD